MCRATDHAKLKQMIDMLNETLQLEAHEPRYVKEEGLLLMLLQESDVFLEGVRPGYLARYGLDYASVHKINPRLVYCSITGFGQESHKPAHDLNVVGLAGLNNHDAIGRSSVSEVQESAEGSGQND